MDFNPSVNDFAIRIAQLEEAYTRISRKRDGDNAPILISINKEIVYQRERLAAFVKDFRDRGNKWVF